MDADIPDPDIEFIDSGMSSLGNSKDETPERRVNSADSPPTGDGDGKLIKKEIGFNDTTENYDDEPDETFYERVWGLTEMFPETIRNVCGSISDFSITSAKCVFNFSCNASWIFFTSSMILFAPILFETERAQMEEMQKSQQKQVLLGPGSAISSTGGGSSGMPALPPMSSR